MPTTFTRVLYRESNVFEPPDGFVPQDVHGWTDFADIYAFAVYEAEETAHFVEVGSWLGKSAILMARLIEASGKSVRLTAVDTFAGAEGDIWQANVVKKHGGSQGQREAFEENLKRYNVSHLVTILQLPSVVAAQRFDDRSLSFVFIDADHAYKAVRADIVAWLPKLIPGGVLAGHNYEQPEVADGVTDELERHRLLHSVRHGSWICRIPRSFVFDKALCYCPSCEQPLLEEAAK